MPTEFRRTTTTIVLALAAALLGALVNGYAYGLSTGARLSAIEIRLASVEHELQQVTCIQIVGTAACTPTANRLRGGL